MRARARARVCVCVCALVFVEQVAQRGFNELKAKQGMYGSGVYFAENSCKAFQ